MPKVHNYNYVQEIMTTELCKIESCNMQLCERNSNHFPHITVCTFDAGKPLYERWLRLNYVTDTCNNVLLTQVSRCMRDGYG